MNNADWMFIGATVAGLWLLTEWEAAKRYGVPMFSQQLRMLRAQDTF